MPTILEVGSYRIFIRLNEGGHHLAHVHVETPSGEVSVALGNARTAPSLVGFSRGTKKADALLAVRLVQEHQSLCLTKWEEHHGR